MRSFVAVLFLIFSHGLAESATAQELVPVGPEFQVNVETANSQLRPRVAIGQGGGLVVTFESFDLFNEPGVRARLYDLNSGAAGSDFQVASADRYLALPDAAVGTDGRFLVVWQNGFDADVFGKFYSATGNLQVGPVFINPSEFGAQTRAAAMPLAEGGFAVVWHDRPSDDDPYPGDPKGPFLIKGRRFSATGSPVGEFTVSELEAYYFNFGVAVDGGGAPGFVVAWADQGSIGDDNSAESIQARRFTDQGQAIGGQFQVNTETPGRQIYPAIAMAPGGDFFVVWESLSPEPNIRGQRYAADGTALGGEFQVNGFDTGAQRRPAISVDSRGNYFVVWDSEFSAGSDTSELSVQLRIFDGDGFPLSDEQQVNVQTTGFQLRPDVATSHDGTFVVVWDGESSAGTDEDFSVQGRRFALVDELCASDDTSLCLNQERFRVEIEWRDFTGNTGAGRVVSADSEDSGLFWFFSDTNWEVLVKVLDGCAFNQHFWVFAAATTDVEYTLRVTDTLTGVVATYFNPLGNPSAAITDTSALQVCGPRSPSAASVVPSLSVSGGTNHLAPTRIPPRMVEGTTPEIGTACTAGSDRLCLNAGRFELTMRWEDFAGNSGDGQVVPLGTDDSGLFWFFSGDNWEVLVKVLDGCAINQHFWVLAAASTDVGYTLTVRDTETGLVKEYRNPLGIAAPAVVDTSAFEVCTP
ncbi:MAG: hypothetical protein AAF657_10590 [Acidobacteriota bacterium]